MPNKETRAFALNKVSSVSIIITLKIATKPGRQTSQRTLKTKGFYYQ